MNVKLDSDFIFYLLFFFRICSLSANEIDSYLHLLSQYPVSLGPLGSTTQQEIEIIRDPIKMQAISKASGREVGIIYRDKYWIWLNDPVQFPNGTSGVYGRILWVRSLEGTPGVAVMPILPDGKIVLNRTFRHATRSWEFELPRGIVEKGETLLEAAVRETKEETGMLIEKIERLGEVAVDTGMTNTIVPVYMAKVCSQQGAKPDDSEAIAGIHAFTVAELKLGFRKGCMCVEIDEKLYTIHLRDPFLAFALFQKDLIESQVEN